LPAKTALAGAAVKISPGGAFGASAYPTGSPGPPALCTGAR